MGFHNDKYETYFNCKYHRNYFNNYSNKNNRKLNILSIFKQLIAVVIVGVVPKYNPFFSGSNVGTTTSTLITFVSAQDFVVHFPTDVVPVGPQFIINFTVYNALYTGDNAEKLSFEMQPYVTEAPYTGGVKVALVHV